MISLIFPTELLQCIRWTFKPHQASSQEATPLAELFWRLSLWLLYNQENNVTGSWHTIHCQENAWVFLMPLLILPTLAFQSAQSDSNNTLLPFYWWQVFFLPGELFGDSWCFINENKGKVDRKNITCWRPL